jgi:membrane protein implicated in regulation of membrane protease activity
MIAIGILMFKLGVLTVILSALTLAGQVVGFIVAVLVFGFLWNLFIGRNGKKNVHTLRKDQWRNL